MADSENTGGAVPGAEDAKARRRAGLRPWRKGQSGNPGGRPKLLPNFRDRMQAKSTDAERALFDGLADSDPRIRIAAAREILAYAWGKPAQAITGADGGPIEVARAVSAEERAWESAGWRTLFETLIAAGRAEMETADPARLLTAEQERRMSLMDRLGYYAPDFAARFKEHREEGRP